MTLRLDDDELDARWREGLRAGIPLVEVTGVAERVAHVVSRRRRRRVSAAIAVGLMTTALMAGGAFVLTRTSHSASVRAAGSRGDESNIDKAPVTAVLHVTAEASLKLRLDRTTVPAGVVEIVYVDGGGRHGLRIEAVPGFRLGVPPSPQVARVRLSPGRYVLYCDIPGHRQAGEHAVLTVEPLRARGASSPPPVGQNTSPTQAWADMVAPYLPAGTTILQVQEPASTVLANTSTTLLQYRLPSGRYFLAERDKAGTLGRDTWANLVLPGGRGDTESTTATGSRRYVITHNPTVTQVIIQRPNGTNLMLRIDSAPGVSYTQPPEFDVDGLIALSDALDHRGSNLP